jgi:hypothetical protein
MHIWVKQQPKFKYFKSREKNSRILAHGEKMSGGIHPKRMSTHIQRKNTVPELFRTKTTPIQTKAV